AESVTDLPDLVHRREVRRPARSAVLDPGRDATIVREVLQAAEQLPAETVDMIVVFGMLSEDLDRLHPCRHSDRVSVVGARMEGRVPPTPARFEGLHDLRLASESRELESASRDFPEGLHVRADVVVFLRAPVRPAEAGEDLVAA